MKRLLMVLVVLGTLASPSRAAAQSIPVGPGSDLSSLVGLPIDVPFVVDMSARSERLGSFALRIQWDPTKLSIVWVGNASFGSVQVDTASLALGIAQIAGVNPAGATGRVTLATARITPLVSEATTLQVSLTELYAAGTFADLLPSAVVTSGAYCPARGRWGDIDGDGNANSRDALIALSNAVGLDVSAFDVSLGDVDVSGTTNARDALIILSNAVGVDVSAFRVLRLAAGACAGNAARALSIVPGGLDTLPVVVGQTVRFEARAGDWAGGLQAITDVNWRSDNTAVLGVLADGSGVARAAGTAIVTVRRGTSDSAQVTVHVVAQRKTHWVDAQAAGATNRLGSVALPFGTLNEGVRFAQAGDTVRVRVGVYDLNGDGDGSLYVSRSMVVIGDTAADGSRPAIAGTSENDGVWFNGSGSVQIENFDVSGFLSAFVVDGPSCVLIRGVRASRVEYGVYANRHAGCVRIERSRLMGLGRNGSGGYSGKGVELGAAVDTLTIEDSDISDFAYGIYDGSRQIDSLTIRRSVLHDVGNSAVYVSAECGQCSFPSQAVVIDSSRLVRAVGPLVHLETVLRRAVIAHSSLTNPDGDVLSVTSNGAGSLTMTGDSVIAPPDQQHNQWLYAGDLASVVIDSVLAVGFYYSDIYGTPQVQVSHSMFRDVRGDGEGGGYGLWVSPPEAGTVLVVDSVGIYGDPRDDISAVGLSVAGVRATIDQLTAVNLSNGVMAENSDSSVAITHSLFQHAYSPVVWNPASAVAPGSNGLTVQNTTFRGFNTAIEAYDGTLVVDSNTFVNGYTAISGSSPKPLTVTRNRISGIGTGVYFWNYGHTAEPFVVTDNVLSGVTSEGIYVGGDVRYPDTLQTVVDVQRNTVACTGVETYGIDLWDAHFRVLNNQVDGCYSGLLTSVWYGNVTRSDTVMGNVVSVGSAPDLYKVGIGVSGNVAAIVSHNTVSGAASGAQQVGLIDVSNCPSDAFYYGGCTVDGANLPTALVDSNSVTGGMVWGIHAENVDSLDIVGNDVQNLNLASGAYYLDYEKFGAIGVFGYLENFGRILGNIIRHIHGNGIVILFSSESENTLLVDSNVVADIDSSGLTYQPTCGNGGAEITRNLFTRAHREALLISWCGWARANDNNIYGNRWGVRSLSEGYFDATYNWWGDEFGPFGCDETGCGGAGDSVDTYVDWWPPLPEPNPEVPPLPSPAPRFMAQASAAPPVRAIVSTDPLDAPIAARARPSTPTARPARPVSAARPGAAGTDRFAERRAAEERDRTEREARAATRLQQLRERAAARVHPRRTSSSAPRAPRSQGVRP